jgi:lactoylglutathione lyase
MAITDLGHSAFRCANLEKSLAFYKLLGITESFRLHRDDGSLMLVYLHIAGDRFIELFPNGPEPAEPKGSFMHLCLVTDDIHAMVDHLRSQGVEIWREIKQGLDSNLQAWIKDPDLNQIELMQLSEGSPQRRVARGELSKS